MTMPNWFRASRKDVLILFPIGAVAILVALVQLIGRLTEVVPNRNVPVEIDPSGLRADFPLGPGGEPVGADVGSIVVLVSDLPLATYVSVLGVSVVSPVAWIVVAVLGLGFCRSLLRGEVFTPANTLRVNLVAATILGGTVLNWLFETLQHNGVLAALSAPDSPTSLGLQIDFLPWFAGMAFATFASALNVGERLQRETEGLV